MIGDLLERWRVQTMRALQGWATEKRTLRGIPVTLINTRPDVDSELVFRRLDTALGLIQQYQPTAFENILRDFSRIQVARFPCRGAFFPDSRICLTELTFTVNPEFNEAQVASSIVHEGMHARLHALNESDPRERPDEERQCRLAELEFGRAVPNGQAIVERALQSLALGDADVAPVIDWDEAQHAVAQADARASAAQLRDDSAGPRNSRS